MTDPVKPKPPILVDLTEPSPPAPTGGQERCLTCYHSKSIHDTGWDATGCMVNPCSCRAFAPPPPDVEGAQDIRDLDTTRRRYEGTQNVAQDFKVFNPKADVEEARRGAPIPEPTVPPEMAKRARIFAALTEPVPPEPPGDDPDYGLDAPAPSAEPTSEDLTREEYGVIFAIDPMLSAKVQDLMGERAVRNLENARLKAELKDEEHSRDLHSGLNRRAAQALGKPFEGPGSSWHDIPECITALRERIATLEQENARLKAGIDRDEAVVTLEAHEELLDKTLKLEAALAAMTKERNEALAVSRRRADDLHEARVKDQTTFERAEQAESALQAERERVRELVEALEHMQHCRPCSEGSWEDCDEGRKALAALQPTKEPAE